MSLDEQPARRVSRKLQRKRRDGDHTPTMELPERLKECGDHGDSEEEVLGPHGHQGGMFMNMNQSIFGLIAAAGSQVDFADRFEGQSSDDEDDGDNAMAMTIAGHQGSAQRGQQDTSDGSNVAQTMVLRKPGASGPKSEGRHRRKISESRLLRSVPVLARLTSKSKTSKLPNDKTSPTGLIEEKNKEDADTAATADAAVPGIEFTRAEGRLAPIMSRMLEARAEMAARPSFDLDRLSGEQTRVADSSETGPTELAKKLKEIFEFEEPEEVIEGKKTTSRTSSRKRAVVDVA